MSSTFDVKNSVKNVETQLDKFIEKEKQLKRDHTMALTNIDNQYKYNCSKMESKQKQNLTAIVSAREKGCKDACATKEKKDEVVNQYNREIEAIKDRIDMEQIRSYKDEIKLCDHLLKPSIDLMKSWENKINDGSVSGFFCKLFKRKGYKSNKEMYYYLAENIFYAERYVDVMLYENEKTYKNACENYRSIEIISTDNHTKVCEQQKKNEFTKYNNTIAKENQEYSTKYQILKNEIKQYLESKPIENIDQNIRREFVEYGGTNIGWDKYEATEVFSEKLLIGNSFVPFSLKNHFGDNIVHKMPFSYVQGTVKEPIYSYNNKPIKLFIQHNESTRNTVMQGIQSIMMKMYRFMPLNSFDVLFIDPTDRGTNLGVFNNNSNSLIGIKCCNEKSDIQNVFKQMEKTLDTISADLGAYSSVYEYNKANDNFIVLKLIILNDFPKSIEQNTLDSLSVIIKNADKCGISIIINSAESPNQSGLPLLQDFMFVNATRNDFTIKCNQNSVPFVFDKLPATASDYVDSIRNYCISDQRVNNRFNAYFNTKKFPARRESHKKFSIPFAVNSRNKNVELDLNGTHTLITGMTNSGKSTTLHMLISSLMMHYSPDDVELWLIDYNKVEFAEYMHNTPPHIKFIGLEDQPEFTFSFLDKLKQEFERRMNFLKDNDCLGINEYKKLNGADSIPRIVVIVDEFHKMTQTIKSESDYVIILENALSEYRKFGLTFIFSDQSGTEGLSGLTPKAKNQIGVRLSMKQNDPNAVKAIIELNNSYYSDNLNARIGTMGVGDVLYKRVVEDDLLNVKVELDIYKALFVTPDERRDICATAIRNDNGKKRECLVIDEIGRKMRDEELIRIYAEENELYGKKQYPMFVGTPSSLKPCFHFTLEPISESNIMVIGADHEMRGSIVLNMCKSFLMIEDASVIIFASEEDEMFESQCDKFRQLGERVAIYTDIEDICCKIDSMTYLLAEKKSTAKDRPPVLLVWLGLDDIIEEFREAPAKNNGSVSGQSDSSYSGSSTQNILNNLDLLLQRFDESNEEPTAVIQPAVAKNMYYNACDDVQIFMQKGPARKIFSLVALEKVSSLRRVKCLKLSDFEHKISLKLSSDDSYDYFGKYNIASTIEKTTAVYFDGSQSRAFRPYLSE